MPNLHLPRIYPAFLALVALVTVGCPGQPPAATPQAPAPAARVVDDEPVDVHPSKTGLGFRLSEADGKAPPPAPPAKTVGLTAEDTAKVLKRMPPLDTSADDAKAFAFRPQSPPPPRTGKTVKETFPPPDRPHTAPPPVASGSLQILRRQPEGEVPLAPRLSITFSQPMVPLTALADLEKLPIPAKITPEPKGKWRWLGTQTLVFEPEKRFPMATEYQVEIAAGTRAQNGGALAAPFTWKFGTPAPSVILSGPGGSSNKLSPLAYFVFDQEVDPADVLKHITLQGGPRPSNVNGTATGTGTGSGDTPIRLATDDEIEKELGVRNIVKNEDYKGRFVVFRAAADLVPNTHYAIKLAAGSPSREGPRVTKADVDRDFSTYGPMNVVKVSCSWSGPCAPLAPVSIELTNALGSAFDKASVSVEPEVKNLKIEDSGSYITLHGDFKGRRDYTVKIKKGIPDVFGQSLEADVTKTVTYGPAESALFSESVMHVLDPRGGGKYSLYSINEKQLKVSLYGVSPQDWPKYLAWRSAWDDESRKLPPPGKLLSSRVVATGGEPDALTETLVDLSPALKHGVGQVVLLVEPIHPPRADWGREWVRDWLQVTKLAIEGMGDGTQVLGFTTALDRGTPEPDVNVTAYSYRPMSESESYGRVKTRLLDAHPLGKTDASGLGTFPFTGDIGMLVATKGDDSALLTSEYEAENILGSATGYALQRWLVFDDRHLYKPSETAHVKGWLRTIQGGKTGDVGGVAALAGKDIGYRAVDSLNVEFAKGATKLDATGGFDITLAIPNTPNLGDARIEFQLGSTTVKSSDYAHSFQIQEFRTPEFEVNADAGSGPYYVGRHATATVAATYFAGGGLAGANVDWHVSRADASFAPPNHSEYSFGRQGHGRPWWMPSRGRSGPNGPEDDDGPTGDHFTSHTDGQGKHRLRVDFDAMKSPRPLLLSFEASVADVNRQTWTARTTMLVHPSSLYVGLKQTKAFVRAGEPIKTNAIVTDIDGNPVPGTAIKMHAARLEWDRGGDGWEEKEVEPVSCDATSTAGDAPCEFPTKRSGHYRLSAEIQDSFGRKNLTEAELYVIGDDAILDRDLHPGEVKLVPDKKTYKTGETAEILIVSPFAPAEALVTIRREGMLRSERRTLKTTNDTVKVKIEEGYLPNVFARVDLVGMSARTGEDGAIDPKLPKQPAFAGGEVNLSIPPAERKLSIAVKPRGPKIEPGAETQIDFEVKDAAGNPKPGATLAIAVVDESVLALTAYHLPEPLDVFYTQRGDGTSEVSLHSFVQLARPDVASEMHVEVRQPPPPPSPKGAPSDPMASLAGIGRGYGGGAMGLAAASPPPMAAPSAAASGKAARMQKPKGTIQINEVTIEGKDEDHDGVPDREDAPAPNSRAKVRKDFSALALFAPKVTTGDGGKVTVPLKLPDSLTRYRVMAVAVEGENRFGTGEATITARLPLMVRPSAPRFLNFGDTFELPVVVQNQTDQPMTVDVVGRAGNAILRDPNGRRVVVPANDRVEVRLPAAAASAGTARFQVGAASGGWIDAASVELPVWTPATTEAFATYGQIDEGAIAQKVAMPTGVFPQFGGLEITTSSTAVASLTDAVLYLVRYPYECNEQISSRVMAVAALRDVLSAFKAEGLPKPGILAASVNGDLDRLASRQHWSGGWSFWNNDREPWPYLSVHVAHALVRAKDKGYKPKQEMFDRARGYLRSIESHIPYDYPASVRRAITAYALFVRSKMGDPDRARVRKLLVEYGGADQTPLEVLGWLLPVISGDDASQPELDAIRKQLQNRVTETPGEAHFATQYEDGVHLLLASDRRADGVILDALIGDQPKSDLIPKLVAGLLNHRTAGRWASTQENAFVLLALDRYFKTYEKVTPDFVARAWLGNQYAGDHAFKGRTTDNAEIDVPMALLAKAGAGTTQDLTIAKDGPGRLYYRVGMKYAPTDLKLPPYDAGFQVTREYEPIDNPGDVKKDDKGTWHVKAGSKVRVRVTMVVPTRRYHVALTDPIPAGFEALNSALAVTESLPADPKGGGANGLPWWWSRAWYEHQNLRDERVEAFATLVWEGDHEYTYVARATTPGTFVVPPPKAEEMYAPEVFGRGGGDKVIVE